MNPHRSRPTVSAGLVLLATAAIGALLAQGGCSHEDGGRDDQPEDGLDLDPATRDTIEQLFGSQSPTPSKPQRHPYPTLAFELVHAGLPTEGTWRERPLLHDFNADGRADLVASNREEDGLNVWEAPGTHGDAFTLRIAGIPRDLMYGGSDGADLDGDGDQDLVFVAHGEGLTVFSNDGKLGWTQGDPLENPFLVLDVCLGDLDGDGNHDAVAIGHFEGGVGAYLGDGAGHFQRLPQSDQILKRSRFGTRVELADMDGDGLDDMALTAEKGATVLYTRRDPESKVLSWEDGSEGLPRPSIGNALRSVVPADFDGDGHLDIALAGLSDHGLAPEDRDNLGIYRKPEGTWVRFDQGLPRKHPYEDMAAGDFNRDGKLDLMLVTSEVGVMLWLGDGAGSFTCKGVLEGSWVADRIALGDANGDGWLDVAILSSDTKNNRSAGGLVVWLNREETWGL